jgi:DNA-binding transcriptional LysR family regulator
VRQHCLNTGDHADRLAARSGLRLANLAGKLLPYGTAAEKGLPQPPFDHHEGLDHSQIFSLIEVGSAVWFVPVWLAERFARPGIAYRPVEGLEPATLKVAWPARSRSAAVAAFVQTVQRIARDAAPYDNPFPLVHPA